jgi:hypothetical protein
MAEGNVGRWSLADGRRKRWLLAKRKALGGWPLLWPDTYLRRLNQTIEKIFINNEALIENNSINYKTD